jgi:MFS family permease
VAIAILVYSRTHSPFLTALAYALTYLPPIAGGPLLSGLANLFPRRRLMIVCDLFRVGTVGLMAIPGLPFAALCILLFCTVLTVGLLMAAVPLGMVIGAFVISRIAAPVHADEDDGLARRPVLCPADRQCVESPAVGRADAVDAGGRGRRLPARRGRLIQALPNGPESPGPGG